MVFATDDGGARTGKSIGGIEPALLAGKGKSKPKAVLENLRSGCCADIEIRLS
jgi:hypothetical protein